MGLSPDFCPEPLEGQTIEQYLDSIAGDEPKSQIAQDTRTTDNEQIPYYASLTIDRLYRALVCMIEILQKAAAAQADRLKVLAGWQRQYTDLISQVPVFFRGGDLFGETDDADDPEQPNSTARDDMNRLNSSFTESLQNFRSSVADDAKGLQSSLNQTTDAVENQASSATGILQQLQTILQSIFKS
jgi:hypothetical protein